MSTKTLQLKIVTPERVVLEETVDQVTLPTIEGEITILPDHIPLVSALKSGDIVAKKNGEPIPFAVSGGFIEVKSIPPRPTGTPPNLGGERNATTASANGFGVSTEVIILADFAEHVEDLTQEEIEKAKARSRELEKMKHEGHVDFEHFEAELERSLNRVKIADKWRSKKYRR